MNQRDEDSFPRYGVKKCPVEWDNHIPNPLIILLVVEPRTQLAFTAAKARLCPACHPPSESPTFLTEAGDGGIDATHSMTMVLVLHSLLRCVIGFVLAPADLTNRSTGISLPP